jgi:alkylhydroperoxidase family enzyme
MADIMRERDELVARLLKGPGYASHSQRRAAFDNSGLTDSLGTLIDKVAKHAFKVTDQDIAAAGAAGLSEDQIFELVVCAAIGEATRQYDSALSALDAATKGSAHAPRDPR